MSKWSGKYVIGLTGNIATGKSVVRKMLEHLGAYGIDADALAHRAIAQGAPGYQPVIETFGRWVLAPTGEIDRAKLGKLVFSDPTALNQLEQIIHPLVSQAIDIIVRRATQTVIVIEAIKLLESDLAAACDAIWVSYTPPAVQLQRLVQNRKMSEEDAKQRIIAQGSQNEKLNRANIVIRNTGTFAETWRQVNAAWLKIGPFVGMEETPAVTTPLPARGELRVQRGRPRHSEQIAILFNRLRPSQRKITSEDVMADFGEKAFLLLEQDNRIVGAIGWQVENLVARTTDLYLDPSVQPTRALPILMREVEKASRDLQCEASLLFIQPELARLELVWKELGYSQRTPETLGVQAWREAAIESMPPGTVLFFKQLRVDRVLRPI